jgi:hypothetical protein
MAIQENIALFFRDPISLPAQFDEFYSVLYLLRRDINYCIPVPEPKLIWPATMAILAGIDLLAKFYAGEDKHGKVRQRFQNFVNEYFQPISSDDVETVYQLRNSLLHSFGLYSKSSKQEYRFILILPKAEPLVQQRPENVYLISITALYEKFEAAIRNYREDVERNPTLQDKFSRMFPNYGVVRVHPIFA